MAVAIGLDAGTTTITALALDLGRGEVVTSATCPNDAEVTAATDAAKGRSEWDVERIGERSVEMLRAVMQRLPGGPSDVAGIGLTGQQHGVVLVDRRLRPLSRFISWRDRRGLEVVPGTEDTSLGRAARLVGPEASRRAGCALAPGFMGTTLFWMREVGVLPRQGMACFITDYLGARLTGEAPVTDPTMGASSGLFHLAARDWDAEMIRSLGLPASLFPEVREAGDRFGALTADMAGATGFPAGVPVFVGLGDNQAAFLGSVADHAVSVQLHVGTGGQVGRYTEDIHHAPPLEVRPFPRAGYLLVEAGLCGGRSYATLRRFWCEMAACLHGATPEVEMYALMNTLAKAAPPGAGGVRCEPFFTGTRAEPDRRANWSDISEENFTPAHMVRALLEGMARAFHDGARRIQAATGAAATRLIGAGNGVRENPVFAGILAEEFGLPLSVPAHHEETAFGAALTAALGAGLLPDLAAAGALIRYRTM